MLPRISSCAWGTSGSRSTTWQPQAGIGKGTVYLHWKTREELFYSVIMREQAQRVEEQLAALHRDPREVQLHRLVRLEVPDH